MKKLTTLFIILLLIMGCETAPPPTEVPSTDIPPTETPIPIHGTITIDPEDRRQTIEGFGASGAWWAQHIGGWEDSVRQPIIDLLFDQENGIGLSIYRYNIGGGDNRFIMDDWRRAETFEVSEGVYDWSRDANAIWVLKAAQNAGVENFVAFANSPPARMTISGRTNNEFSNDPLSNLAPEMYSQYAQYLVDIVHHLQETEGVPIGWLSPINEPQWDWQIASGQEGSHYTPAQAAAVTKAVWEAMEANQLDVKLSVFEGGEWAKSSTAYVAPLLSNSELAPHIDHIAIHSYWSTAEDKAQFVRMLDERYPDMPIEMTEWTEMNSGQNVSIDTALTMANVIHDDLTIGRVTSWQYWIAVSKYDFRDGLIYVDVDSHEMTETKRLWAMGNFSRFVRPESQRILTENDHDKLNTTAFLSPDQSELIMVVINNDAKALNIALAGISEGYGQIEIFETSAENDLAEIFSGSTPSTFMFEPKSVTTLVFSK